MGCSEFTDDFAAVIVFPGWSFEVFANNRGLILRIVEIGRGALQNPGVFLIGAGLAGIELRAVGVDLEDQLFRRWRLKVLGNLRAGRPRLGKGIGAGDGGEKKEAAGGDGFHRSGV